MIMYDNTTPEIMQDTMSSKHPQFSLRPRLGQYRDASLRLTEIYYGLATDSSQAPHMEFLCQVRT